jgi:glycosyltransferase involved in cell wall biosynthesis
MHCVPHIMTAHDVFQDVQFVGWKGRFKRFALTALMNRISFLHTVSEDGAKNLRQYLPGVAATKLRPILNGIDCESFFNAQARNIRAELGLGDHQVVIGFFGRFMGQKGFRYLVEAISLLINDPSVSRKPVVVAFGWGGYVREDWSSLERRGLAEHFFNMPHTDDMPAAIKGVDIVAMPSLWEAGPLLAMEALAAGVPITGTNCIGLREVLEGSPADQVPLRDAKALAASLKNYINEPRNKSFEAYIPEAHRRFAIERSVDALRLLYDECLGAHPK